MDKEDPKELEALRRKYAAALDDSRGVSKELEALRRKHETLRLAAVETLDAWDKAESTARLVVSIKRLRTAVG